MLVRLRSEAQSIGAAELLSGCAAQLLGALSAESRSAESLRSMGVQVRSHCVVLATWALRGSVRSHGGGGEPQLLRSGVGWVLRAGVAVAAGGALDMVPRIYGARRNLRTEQLSFNAYPANRSI